MAARAGLKINNSGDWAFRKSPAGRRSAAGKRAAAAAVFPEAFLSDEVEVETVEALAPAAGRRRAAAKEASPEIAPIDLSIPVEEGAARVIAIRHPSGALTFHAGERDIEKRSTRSARGTRKTSVAVERFRISVREDSDSSGKRGIVGKIFKVIVLKVANLIADAVLSKLVLAWEKRNAKKHGRAEQWLRVTEGTLAKGPLAPAVPGAGGKRALLLLHGTFSDTVGSFKNLAKTKFMAEAAARYGEEIYGYDHFTLGRSALENARNMLEALPEEGRVFDVVTYSRGGLVLRAVSEDAGELGALTDRMQLGQIVLVASPNGGTPLATPKRWRETVGRVATLLDHFPDNPFTTGASFVADAIVWIASRAVGAAPGLESMNGAGKFIRKIQESPSPAGDAYSSLVANHYPEKKLRSKLLDISADTFFGTANDLVVPSEGGWLVDDETPGAPFIPGDRIGCYGPGGNISPEAAGVNHINLFGREDTADFILRALAGEPHPLPMIDPGRKLPNRRRRGAAKVMRPTPRAPISAGAPTQAQFADAIPGADGFGGPYDDGFGARGRRSEHFSDTLELTIIEPEKDIDTAATDGKSKKTAKSKEKFGQLYAQYRGARVIVPFKTSGDEHGQRWKDIIGFSERIRSVAEGEANAQPLAPKEFRTFGSLLFETMFPSKVRRLYDVARVRESGRPGRLLNVVLTSQIDWVANKPWEFAFDPNLNCYLATEEIRFIRNEPSEAPAEHVLERNGPLRILVVAAQPITQGDVTIEEEKEVILRGFKDLIDANLLQVEVLESATVERLHETLIMKEFDALHFIGHGIFDTDSDTGALLLEDADGFERMLYADDLRRIFRKRGLRLVFLNACETGRSNSAPSARGVAQTLAGAGIQCVVANQYSVYNSAATDFSQVFYWLMAQGATVGDAAREARIAVNYGIEGEAIDWAIPVVYARDPEFRLCAERKITTSMKSLRHDRQRRKATDRKMVGVWDIDGAFPQLTDTLDRLTAAQDRYDFSVVTASPPIGVLRKTKEWGLQFNADIAAKRLQALPAELGVDFVYCLTRHPIMYTDDVGEDYNYTNWWPEKGASNVLIGSTHNIEMPVSRHLARRIVANIFVQGLIGLGAEMYAHKRGPKDCPLYYNGELDADIETGPQKIDATCRKRIVTKMPDDLPALEKILRVFDKE